MSDKHIVRGVVAGVAGGLFASWVMNEFMAGPGKQLTKTVQNHEKTHAQNHEKNQEQARRHAQYQAEHKDDPDATMKAADRITEFVTGGRHLTYEQEQIGGPIVHYAFGALMGGLYGGLAEYSSAVRSGLGTTFATVLFASADLLAVPALHLSAPLSETPAETLITPYAAHLVYGISTDLVRRLVRSVL